MQQQLIATFLVAVVFAGLHAVGPALGFLRSTPRSVWLSISGGVAVAYVFVHVLPDLATSQADFSRELEKMTGAVSSIERHTYIIALLGLSVFYGLYRLARQSRITRERQGQDGGPSLGVYRINLGAYAIYNVLIGYLLVHREEMDTRGLIIYAVAMGLHFLLNDQALREEHGAIYDARGRWLLAGAPIVGWALGYLVTLHPLAITTLFAFLMGGVVLNVLKEELPQERESSFWAFALGAALYSALLILTR